MSKETRNFIDAFWAILADELFTWAEVYWEANDPEGDGVYTKMNTEEVEKFNFNAGKEIGAIIKRELPKVISSLCIQMLKSLNLAFGAFDFALRDKEYFFLEVNPTGEWAWLVDAVDYPIPKTIANALQRSPHVN